MEQPKALSELSNSETQKRMTRQNNNKLNIHLKKEYKKEQCAYSLIKVWNLGPKKSEIDIGQI